MNLPSKKSFKKIILVLLGVAATAVLAYLLVVRPIQVRQEKKQFEQAAAELEKLYTRIEAVAGKPDQIKREKTCDRPNLKGAKGPVSCNVTISLLYDNVGFNRASSIRDDISNLISVPVVPDLARQGVRFIEEISTISQQKYYQRYDSMGFSCATSYRYPARPGKYHPFKPASDLGLVVGLSCGKGALAEHFPVRK